jgi:hypothetical protein
VHTVGADRITVLAHNERSRYMDLSVHNPASRGLLC